MQTSFIGHFGRLEKLKASEHGVSLWETVRGHEKLWDYMAYGPFDQKNAFMEFLSEIETKQDPFFYAVLDTQNKPVGWLSLMDYRSAHKVIEVGHILFSPALQRTPLATEAVYLLLKYGFEELNIRRFEWKCNNNNAPSKQAALRFGFTFEGVFRQHLLVKGLNRDTAWFSILDKEWAVLNARFKNWLSPLNFDTKGQQIKHLRDINT
jgi:RimJ/RimL family protein N-acetyltransferase